MKKQSNELNNLKDVLSMYKERVLAINNDKVDTRSARATFVGLRGILSTLRLKVDRINRLKSKEPIHFIDDVQL